MAPPSEPPTTITLRVKVPPGSIPGGADEFTLGTEVPVSARIGQVRERIQKSLPSSPPPERQRILYGGRALVDNEQTLSDALNIRRDPSQDEYVIHLLVRTEGAGVSSVASSRGMSTPSRSGSPAQPQTSQTSRINQHHVQHHVLPNATQHVQQQSVPNNPAALAQQQGLHAQMHFNAVNHNRFQTPQGAVAPGMHPMHFAQHNMPTPDLQPGISEQHGREGGQDALGQEGMQSQHADTRVTRTFGDVDDQVRGQRSRLDGASSQQAVPNSAPQRPISNQGFHMEGIGPNGERIIVHHQTLNFPQSILHGQPMQIPSHYPQVQTFPGPLPGMPFQPPPRPSGPSALDQARENIANARQRLAAIRNTYDTGAEADARVQGLSNEVEQIERMIQAVNDYIDPLQLGRRQGGQTRTANSQSQSGGQMAGLAGSMPLPSPATWQQQAQSLRQQQQRDTGGTRPEVTCYLLSSPTGPQAILYSPHGTFQGSLPGQSHQITPSNPQPTPTTTVTAPGDAAPPEPAAHQEAAGGVAAPLAQAAQQAAQQDPLGPLAPVMNHVWLLLRILLFSYFLLGANMGWRRPLALAAIGLGFWMIRMGLLAEGAAMRRWWDGIMNENQQQPRRQQEQAEPHRNVQGQQQEDEQPILRPGQMPTPEQVAQRLLDADARIRNHRLQRIREYVRPVERAAALLVASLWPGVGEAYVRAREQEERQRAEEEVAARRREEEERQREEDKSEKPEGSAVATDNVGDESKSAVVDKDVREKATSSAEKSGT